MNPQQTKGITMLLIVFVLGILAGLLICQKNYKKAFEEMELRALNAEADLAELQANR